MIIRALVGNYSKSYGHISTAQYRYPMIHTIHTPKSACTDCAAVILYQLLVHPGLELAVCPRRAIKYRSDREYTHLESDRNVQRGLYPRPEWYAGSWLGGVENNPDDGDDGNKGETARYCLQGCLSRGRLMITASPRIPATGDRYPRYAR